MADTKHQSAKEIIFVKFDGESKGKEGTVFFKESDAQVKHSDDKHSDDKINEGNPNKEGVHVHRQHINDIFKTGSSGGLTTGMSAIFTLKDVCRLFNITEGRLKYWDKSGFISPSSVQGNRRCYSFSDLISIRSALELLENGVTLQRTRVLISQLMKLLPQTTMPLGKLRISGDSKRVTVVEQGREFEVNSGQLVFDFTVQKLEDDVVATLPDYLSKINSRTAYEWYLEASSLDEDSTTFDDAEYAYHQCILLDPGFANAYTNLGNIRYRRGAFEDAAALYQKAIELDSTQPEAIYNLGFIEYEQGNLTKAKQLFEQAVEFDSTFADGYFNLAMTLFKLNNSAAAASYWSKYLELEPVGAWADVARRHLADI